MKYWGFVCRETESVVQRQSFLKTELVKEEEE
jgi:hypothetical protein